MTDIECICAGWLGDLPPEFIEAFVEIGNWIEFAPGEIVYSLGSDDQSIYGVAQGIVRMHLAINEHEQRVAHIAGPGFWFGEHEFVTGHPRIMEMVAGSKLRLLKIRLEDFEKLAQRIPNAWKWILLLAVEHQALAIGAGDDLMLPSSEKRLAASIRTPTVASIHATHSQGSHVSAGISFCSKHVQSDSCPCLAKDGSNWRHIN